MAEWLNLEFGSCMQATVAMTGSCYNEELSDYLMENQLIHCTEDPETPDEFELIQKIIMLPVLEYLF